MLSVWRILHRRRRLTPQRTYRCLACAAVALLLAVLLSSVVTVSASEGEGRVYDPAGLLLPAEASALEAHMDDLSAEHGVELYMATYRANGRYDDYVGDDYCDEIRNLRSSHAVLLIVTYDLYDGNYYYDLYTYGRANSRISNTEVNFILDDDEVYDSLKSGRVAMGAEAFFDRSVAAYSGRIGVSYAIIIPICAIIGLLIGLGVCAGVSAAYRKRHPSVDYPLERFARLELTAQSDAFVTKTVTRAYVPQSKGSGGGSAHGGGGGHRGGR